MKSLLSADLLGSFHTGQRGVNKRSTGCWKPCVCGFMQILRSLHPYHCSCHQHILFILCFSLFIGVSYCSLIFVSSNCLPSKVTASQQVAPKDYMMLATSILYTTRILYSILPNYQKGDKEIGLYRSDCTETVCEAVNDFVNDPELHPKLSSQESEALGKVKDSVQTVSYKATFLFWTCVL